MAAMLYAVYQRYLKFVADIDTPDGGADNLHHLAETEIVDNRRYKGFNLLSTELTALYLCAYTGAHGNVAGARPRTAFVVSMALLFIVATGSLGSFHSVILVLTYLLARLTLARL